MQKGDDFTQLVAYVEERSVLEERLQKMEAFRGTIKDLIFRRVQRDYTTRLTTIRDGFRPTMGDIVKKLKALESDKDGLSGRTDQANDLLSELRFRNEIGEFSENEFHEQEDGFLLQIEELAAELDNLRHTIGDYMFYLHDDKDFRQMASSEKILERLEEDYKAERARAAELDAARWQAQKGAPASTSAATPPRATTVVGGAAAVSVPTPTSASVLAETDEGSFLAQAFAQLEVEDTTRDLAAVPKPPTLGGAAAVSSHTPPPARPAPSGSSTPPPPPRRVAPAAPAAAQKAKVIRKAPNSGG